MERIKTLATNVIKYFKRYQLIFLGIALCHLCAFNFRTLFADNFEHNSINGTLISLFFVISFGFPILFGILFCVKSFNANNRIEAVSNIVHSYLAIVLIFTATYFQCSVLGDLSDASNKRQLYTLQKNRKEQINKNLTFMRVNDQRAFKGIRPRLWSGIDYPELAITLNYDSGNNNDMYIAFDKNYLEDLSIEQIEKITNNINDSTSNVIEYLKENEEEVYGDCLYYSVICIATVGFGDISPNLWYSKFFTVIEIMCGMSIFAFAIGFMFSRWAK